jgi:hypothetical protein
MDNAEKEWFYNDVIVPAALALATKIIEEVRSLEGPVVWLTGNSYVPPARSFPEFEEIYQHPDNTDGELSSEMWEAVTELLDAGEVMIAQPEWDNAIYGVDLRRWEPVESDTTPDDLNDEWQRRQ